MPRGVYRSFASVALIIAGSLPISAQGTLTVSTDKSAYVYGDTMEVRVTVANRTSSEFTIRGSSSCIALITFDEVPFRIGCTADDYPFVFPPWTARTWIWRLRPPLLGIPTKDGQHTIRGSCSTMRDSTFITAPMYRGGRLTVAFGLETPDTQIRSVRDSLRAVVLRSDTFTVVGQIWQTWQIDGFAPDSVADVYSSDSRFKYFYVDRPLQFEQVVVTSVEPEPRLPTSYNLSECFPNPFNPSTTFYLDLPKSEVVQLAVYDIRGRKVATLIDELSQAGRYRITFSGQGLPSGIYFCSVRTGGFQQTRKMVLIR
jgi:hypothetical protein